jgi:hypothetical protein
MTDHHDSVLILCCHCVCEFKWYHADARTKLTQELESEKEKRTQAEKEAAAILTEKYVTFCWILSAFVTILAA